MKSEERSKDLNEYREEMRLEIARNVDQLNKLLYTMAENIDETETPSIMYVCDPSDSLKCSVLDSNGNVLRTLSNEAILRKIKTLESKVRLRRFRANDQEATTTWHRYSDSSNGSLAMHVRQINSSTIALINKLKQQIRVLT